MAVSVLFHAEVFADGAVFYCGLMGSQGTKQYMGVIEAHNLARKLPLPQAEDRAAIMGVVDATFHDEQVWRQVPLADWPEDELCARYESDAPLTRVYEYIPNAGREDA